MALDLAIKHNSARALRAGPNEIIGVAKQFETFIAGEPVTTTAPAKDDKEPKVKTRIEVIDGVRVERRETQGELPIEPAKQPCARCGAVEGAAKHTDNNPYFQHLYEEPRSTMGEEEEPHIIARSMGDTE
jgi:hypothetical protein